MVKQCVPLARACARVALPRNSPLKLKNRRGDMASSNPTRLPSYSWVGRAQGRNRTSFKELTRSCNPRATGNAKFPLRRVNKGPEKPVHG